MTSQPTNQISCYINIFQMQSVWNIDQTCAVDRWSDDTSTSPGQDRPWMESCKRRFSWERRAISSPKVSMFSYKEMKHTFNPWDVKEYSPSVVTDKSSAPTVTPHRFPTKWQSSQPQQFSKLLFWCHVWELLAFLIVVRSDEKRTKQKQNFTHNFCLQTFYLFTWWMFYAVLVNTSHVRWRPELRLEETSRAHRKPSTICRLLAEISM